MFFILYIDIYYIPSYDMCEAPFCIKGRFMAQKNKILYMCVHILIWVPNYRLLDYLSPFITI